MHQLSDCSKIKPLPSYYVPKSGYANDDGTNGNGILASPIIPNPRYAHPRETAIFQ
jgi:hypothetical protein